MTDKEYIEMTRLLESLTEGADTLRDLFPGKVTDEVRSNPHFKLRWGLLDQAEKEVKALVVLINECEDWTSNKFLASEILRRMGAFFSATEEMPKGISWPFKFIRSLCVKPMEMIPGRYPDLADLSARAGDEGKVFRVSADKVTPSIREEIPRKDAGATSAIKHGEKFTAEPNRQELAMCFNEEFRRPRPGETGSKLDKLIHAMQTTSFTRKDWGRVAYAIQANRRIRNDRIYRIGFSKWMVEFFSIIGVPCPGYLRIAEYKDQAGTRSFITNYLSV